MKTTKVAINGFGRIGRAFLKIALDLPADEGGRQPIEIVAINDLGSIESLSYLLKYDTVYGKYNHKVEMTTDSLIIDGKKIKFISERDTTKLPWKELDVDVVVESTGVFNSYDKASFHLTQGAKRIVISAPAKEEDEVKGETVLMGVNEDKLSTCQISSNGSCTTNAASPIISILHDAIGVEKAILNTVHGYTATQSLVDGPSKGDLRKGRAAAQNIIPSSTGAAIAVTEAFPELKGLFDGVAIRVPVISGSIVDITFISKKNTSKEEINEILKKASQDKKWDKIFAVTEDPIVSSDILGESHAAIADLDMTRVVDGNLVKVLAWYDNEMGYTHTLVDHVIKAGETI